MSGTYHMFISLFNSLNTHPNDSTVRRLTSIAFLYLNLCLPLMAAKLSCLMFLSFLVLSNQLLSSECRNLAAPRGRLTLMPMKGFNRPIHEKPILNEHHAKRAKRASRILQGEVDSFRPTAPGHSPGIGHSKND